MCLVGLSPPMNDHPTSQTRSLHLCLTGIGGGRQQFRSWSRPGLSFATFGVFSSLGAGQISGVRSLDQIQQIWFIEWAYYALAHGHNPFFTQLQNFPWA